MLRVASFSCSHVSGRSPGRERQSSDSPWLHVVHAAGVRSQVRELSKGVAAIWPRIGNMGRKREKQEGVAVLVYWGVSVHHDRQKWVCPRPQTLRGMSRVLPNKMASWNQQSARWICWIWCSWSYFSWLDCPSCQGPPPSLMGWFPLWSAERRLHSRHTRWRSTDSHVLARTAGVFFTAGRRICEFFFVAFCLSHSWLPEYRISSWGAAFVSLYIPPIVCDQAWEPM